MTDLRDGVNIDMAVTSNMRVLDHETVLDEFNPQPFYAIVRKDDTELMDEINQGIAQLDINSPHWKTELWDKYYSSINENVIALSASEREYMDELKKNDTVIKVAMNPELRPYSYFENGEAKGISVRIFEEIAEKLGIKYEILESKDRWEYKEQLSSGKADIDLTSYLNFGQAQRYNLKETDAYLTSSIAMLSRKNSNMDPDTMVIAVVKDPTEYISYNDELIYNHHYIEYDSVQECIEAVKKGEADATYRYVYIAERAVTEDYTNKLQYTVMSNYPFSLAVGVRNQEDYRLLSVLNKAVNSLTDQFVQGIMLEETSHMEASKPLLSIIYQHPITTTVMVATVCILLFLSIFFHMRSSNMKKSLQQEKELERFLGYICDDYTLVTEMNLVDRIRTDYYMEDGKLVEHTYPYVPLVWEDYAKIAREEDIPAIMAISDEKQMGELIDSGKRKHFEVQLKDTDGKYRWFAFYIKGIARDEKHPGNYIMFKQDIQEMKEALAKQQKDLRDAFDAAKKANEAKNVFLSRMSHELRTPLNAIAGYAQEQENNCLAGIHDAALELKAATSIIRAVRYQESIIGDLLNIQEIESGRIQLKMEDVDATAFMNDAVDMIRPEAEARNIELIYDRLTTTNENYQIDPVHLQQILFNLLHNAIKFTPEGGKVRLTAEATGQEKDKVFLKFVVSDTGIGMSAEFVKNRLFQNFAQEYEGTTSPYEGCGIGLATCKELVKLMGGTISCVSEPGVGSTFTVELIAKSTSTRRRQRKSREPVPCDLEGIHILLCEDNEMNQDMERRALERMGCTVDVAEDGQIGCELFEKSKPFFYDMILMDIRMPRMDGHEATRKIRTMEREDAKKVTILALSANAFEEDINESKEAGMNEHLAKPMDARRLHEKIISYCRLKSE